MLVADYGDSHFVYHAPLDLLPPGESGYGEGGGGEGGGGEDGGGEGSGGEGGGVERGGVHGGDGLGGGGGGGGARPAEAAGGAADAQGTAEDLRLGLKVPCALCT